MPPLPSPKKTSDDPPLQWRPVIWYFLFTLGMLWVWQEAAPRVVYRTVPYSEFKNDLKQGEVVECVVKETEISGKVRPKPTTSKETSQGTATTTPATQDPHRRRHRHREPRLCLSPTIPPNPNRKR